MGISCEQTLECFRSDDLIGLGMEADAVRRRLHPEGVVSYAICGRPARQPGREAGFFAEMDQLVAAGAGSITIGAEDTESVEQAEALLRNIKRAYPGLWLHGSSAGDVLDLARRSGLSVQDTIQRLRDAGLDSISGEDAGILDGAPAGARVSWRSSDWLEVHRSAHRAGLPTTAAMVFGQGETAAQRVHHLEALRTLQEQTGGFTSFALRTFVPPSAGPRTVEEPTAVEYLKTLAISRMVLDNIANIEIDLDAQGLKVFETCLRFGGNDAGSLSPIGETAATVEQLRLVIRDAGFRPVERDMAYRTMFAN